MPGGRVSPGSTPCSLDSCKRSSRHVTLIQNDFNEAVYHAYLVFVIFKAILDNQTLTKARYEPNLLHHHYFYHLRPVGVNKFLGVIVVKVTGLASAGSALTFLTPGRENSASSAGSSWPGSASSSLVISVTS